MEEMTCTSCIWVEDCPLKKKAMKFGRVCSDYYQDDEWVLALELRADRKQYEKDWRKYVKDAE